MVNRRPGMDIGKKLGRLNLFYGLLTLRGFAPLGYTTFELSHRHTSLRDA